ncbi:hypothetical protein OG394_29200 [Kribbella sp. NBC_01245]|uniref:hypothetical protein n=1 Tax=Kribbella sp. NBC_01245 TaxID=2903578 RepID=UPI002E2B69EF|nr:hypothetical protein [Kribbella sp. NBC_01245]
MRAPARQCIADGEGGSREKHVIGGPGEGFVEERPYDVSVDTPGTAKNAAT